MYKESGRIVIHGNEFYEIDLECEKKKKEGKSCSDTSEKTKARASQDRKEQSVQAPHS